MSDAQAPVPAPAVQDVASNISITVPAAQDVASNTSTIVDRTTGPSFMPASNGTDSHKHWVTREDIALILADSDAVHVMLLALGTLVILVGDKFPKLISAVAAITFGFWCGLMIQERQDAGKSFGNMMPKALEESAHLPGLVSLGAAVAAGTLVHFAQKVALVVLTGGVFMLVCGSVLRLANINPTALYDENKDVNIYGMVGISAFVVGVVVCGLLVKKFHKAMLLICSALIGTLLMISGISYFAQRDGSNDTVPVSLLDDLANTFADVRSGKCHIFGERKGGCDCGEDCKVEIIAWFSCSALVLAVRYGLTQCNKRRKYKLMEDEVDNHNTKVRRRSLQSVPVGKSSTRNVQTVLELEDIDLTDRKFD